MASRAPAAHVEIADPDDACPLCGFSVGQQPVEGGGGGEESAAEEGEEGDDNRICVGTTYFHKGCIYSERSIKREAKLLDLAHDKKGKETPHMNALTHLRKTNRTEYRRRVLFARNQTCDLELSMQPFGRLLHFVVLDP